MAELHEECGVIGVWAGGCDAVEAAYYGLFSLQHRGQESCGIAVNDDGLITCCKDAGLVTDVFTDEAFKALGNGKIAIGHVRYGVGAGPGERFDAQPITVNHIKGCTALATNGALTNAYALREELELAGTIFHTFSDAEVIINIITRERLSSGSIEEAVGRAMDKLKGSYSLVLMSATKLIAVRDPYGFHPLCIGKLGDGWVFASESCALSAIGAEFLRDVRPGEIVTANAAGLSSDDGRCGKHRTALCVFEYIYFARPDSVIDGCSVHMVRKRSGELLARQYPVEADIVIGVPDSGIDAAIGYARESKIPYGVGLIKNRYIGRTFIQPSQTDREDKVKMKLNALASSVRGKRVVMIDDSIVRGTTSGRIVKLLRDAGATEVHIRTSAPAFIHPCYYGTDIDSRDKLFAYRYTHDEMCEKIGVDSLGFLDPASIGEIARGCGLSLCDGCFTGNYPCEIRQAEKKPIYMTRLSERGAANE